MTITDRPDVLILNVPAPCAWINSNDRGNHWAKAKLTKQWRAAARNAAKEAQIGRYERQVHIVAFIHKASANRYDAGNWSLTAKAAVDGLRDAGVLAEDHNAYVIGPDMRAGERAAEPFLELRISEVRDVA